MPSRHSLRAHMAWIVIAAAGAAVACGGEVFTPTTVNVAGSYTATVFTTTTNGVTTNQLAVGSSLTLNLTASGIVTGRIFVPGGAEGGGNLDADMADTWTCTIATAEIPRIRSSMKV